jgi:hypothetical protein
MVNSKKLCNYPLIPEETSKTYHLNYCIIPDNILFGIKVMIFSKITSKEETKMYILSEKDFEDILAIHPELIEEGLVLLERQRQLENRRTDLIFADKDSNLLLTELKRDIICMNLFLFKENYIKRQKEFLD